MEKQKLPKGWYMITDPCYVLSREDYEKVILKNLSGKKMKEVIESGDENEIEQLNEMFNSSNGILEHKEHKLFNHGTYIGDGEYLDNEEFNYFVDSGQLSCVPIEIIEDEIFGKEMKKKMNVGGRRLEYFEEDFECSYDDGTFQFGELTIDTKGEMGNFFEEIKKSKTIKIKDYEKNN